MKSINTPIKMKIKIVIIMLAFVFLLGFLTFPIMFNTGKAILNIGEIDTSQQILEGSAMLSLQKNEIIASDTKLLAELNSQVKQFDLIEVTDVSALDSIGENESVDLEIDLSKLGLDVEAGTLKLQVVYNESVVAETDGEVVVIEDEINITHKEDNQTNEVPEEKVTQEEPSEEVIVEETNVSKNKTEYVILFENKTRLDIMAAPTLTSVSIASNNANTSMATLGNTVTLNFISDEVLLPTLVVYIDGKAADSVFEDGTYLDGMHWLATRIMQTGDTQVTPLTFTIDFADLASNPGTQVIAVTDSSSVTFFEFAGGDGSSGSPYQITNWTELNYVRYALDKYFVLNNNLDQYTSDYIGIGDNWVPIGTSGTPFSGNFNGNGKTISNLSINLPGIDYVGLFGYVDSGGNISNVNLVANNIIGLNYVGSLVGFSGGIISNSSVIIQDSATLNASSYVGLVVGSFGGTATDTYATIYDSQYGNITFLDWDVTNPAGGNLLDYIYINNNSAYVNSESCTGCNVSANITLNGIGDLSLSNPTILKDGTIDCIASGECYNLTPLSDYATSITFNVSGWSNYSIGEGSINNTPPTVTSLILNTTSELNTTNDNLTAYATAEDAEGDNITLAYNWYKNGTLNATTLITDGLVAYYPLNNDTLDYFGANDGTAEGGYCDGTLTGISTAKQR